MRIFRITAVFATLILPATPFLTAPADAQGNESNARPPVTQVDLEIAARAREILDSPSKWNRADTRVCPPTATKFSLYCALEKATKEKSGKFAHRDAAMQEARFVIEDIAPHVNSYEHRLKDYNNDPSTTFADVQKFFEVLETHITKRLASEHIEATPPAPSAATPRSPTQADLQVLQRARDLLDSPERWNRHDDQNCKKQTKTISLFCAMDKASNETRSPRPNHRDGSDPTEIQGPPHRLQQRSNRNLRRPPEVFRGPPTSPYRSPDCAAPARLTHSRAAHINPPKFPRVSYPSVHVREPHRPPAQHPRPPRQP
jgi:hypothetical protein